MIRDYFVHVYKIMRLHPRRMVWTISVVTHEPTRRPDTAGIFHVRAASRDEACANVLAAVWHGRETTEIVNVEVDGLNDSDTEP